MPTDDIIRTYPSAAFSRRAGGVITIYFRTIYNPINNNMITYYETRVKKKPLLCFDRYVDSSHCRGDVAHDIGAGVVAVRRDRRPLHGRLPTPQTVSFFLFFLPSTTL